MASLAATACTSSSTNRPPTDSVTTSTRTLTSSAASAPINTGPTTAATASSCPLIATQTVAGDVGMRLERVTVLRSGGKVVGCRIYALQNSPLHESEHLPPANQPVIEIRMTKYPSALAAHNAFVKVADAGSNPQQATIHGTTGVCFQTAFYSKDAGADWACAWSVGTTSVLLRTVVTSPALNAILVARAIHLPS